MRTINQAMVYQEVVIIRDVTPKKSTHVKQPLILEPSSSQNSFNSYRDHLSHELRISLTGILGASYLLEQTGLNEQQKECLKLLNTATNRLLALADEL